MIGKTKISKRVTLKNIYFTMGLRITRNIILETMLMRKRLVIEITNISVAFPQTCNFSIL